MNFSILKFGFAARSAGIKALATASRSALLDMPVRIAEAIAWKSFLDMVFSTG